MHRGALSQLANELRYRFQENQKRGALYLALLLVSSSVRRTNIGTLLVRFNIHERSTVEQDDKALAALGFPDIVFFKRWNIYSLQNEPVVDKYTFYRLVMAAATILLLEVEETLYDAPRPSPLASMPQPVTTVQQELTLVLVLKGTDLRGIDTDNRPSKEEVMSLLDKASYYKCASQQVIDDILGELNLDENSVDRDSEQQVLVALNFQNNTALPKKGFQNKLELRPYVQRNVHSFKFTKLAMLMKLSTLVNIGFTRS